MAMHLIGVYLMGMHLIDMYLMGMHLKGVAKSVSDPWGAMITKGLDSLNRGGRTRGHSSLGARPQTKSHK
jgi:hypothetical protein